MMFDAGSDPAFEMLRTVRHPSRDLEHVPDGRLAGVMPVEMGQAEFSPPWDQS
jgi:hypothetical protein